jgi:predicted alpha/beta hydrolase
MNSDECAGNAVSLRAADGYPLAARWFAPAGEERGRLVIAGATGVPQRFYRRFAEHAASRGFASMTFDYRGIGLSRPASLRGFEASFLDWARLDLAAAVAHLRCDAVPLHLIGHSFGGHAIGLLPDLAGIDRCYVFGTGSGWHGWMPPLERVRVLLLWHLVAPLATRWHGYLPWSRMGAGEDLPIGVYREWKRWCSFPHYLLEDPSLTELAAQYARVTMPMVAVNALDDHWAQPAARNAFMPAYCNAPWRGLDIDPVASGIGPLGHMGYFRPQARALWDRALDWLEQSGRAAELAL